VDPAGEGGGEGESGLISRHRSHGPDSILSRGAVGERRKKKTQTLTSLSISKGGKREHRSPFPKFPTTWPKIKKEVEELPPGGRGRGKEGICLTYLYLERKGQRIPRAKKRGFFPSSSDEKEKKSALPRNCVHSGGHAWHEFVIDSAEVKGGTLLSLVSP